MPTISICIPAYNAEAFIGPTLETLLDQSYKDLEIIVSDNNSRDCTANIVKLYQEKDSRIRLTNCPVIRKDGSLRTISLSAVDNFNHVLTMAKSDFVALYHADDLYHRNILTEQLSLFRRHDDVSAVFTMGRLMDSEGKKVSSISVQLPSSLNGKRIFNHDDLLIAVIEHQLNLMTPTCMMRREAMIQTGFFVKKYDLVGDYDYWFRIAQTGKIAVIDNPLFLHRIGKHQDSFNAQTFFRYKRHSKIELFEDHIMALHNSSAIKSLLLNSLGIMKMEEDLNVIGNLILDSKTIEAKRMLDQAIRAIGNIRAMPHITQIHIWLQKLAVNAGMGSFFLRIYYQLFEIVRSVKWRKRSLKPSDLGHDPS